MPTYNTTTSGLSVRLIASLKYPAGFTITAFATDADPLDFPEVTIGEGTMNLNGDMVANKTPSVYPVSISVIPGSDDDANLDLLFQANMPKRFAQMDDITMIVSYPDGSVRTALGGICNAFQSGRGVNANSSAKSRTYKFQFSEIAGI